MSLDRPREMPQKPSMDNALQFIEIVEQQVRQAGRVDSEPDMLNALRAKVLAREIAPEEAIAQARSILETRQDYN